MRAEYTSRSRYKTNAFIAILLLLRGHIIIIIITLLFAAAYFFHLVLSRSRFRFSLLLSLLLFLFFFFLQQRFNQRLLVLRGGTVSVHDVAFAVDDKLRLKVPSYASRKFVQTIRPHRRCVCTFHVSFRHDGPVEPFLSGKLFNVRVVRQLLPSKLSAWKQKNLQTFGFIFLLERNKSLIIAARRASPRRHVRD